MFSTIVVGTDGSATAKSAVEIAAHIARQNAGTLHLVAVCHATAGCRRRGPRFGGSDRP